MTTNQSAKLWAISTTVEEIVFERFIAKLPLPDLDYLSSGTVWSKREIRLLKKYYGKLFTVEHNKLKIVGDTQSFEQKAKNFLTFLIKKQIFLTDYAQHTFADDFKKLGCENCFSDAQLAFIDEIYNVFCTVSDDANDGNASKFMTDDVLLLYNALNQNNFYYPAQRVLNGVLQGALHAGDEIGAFINLNWEICGNVTLPGILQFCKYFDWFLEIVEGKVVLLCDLETNRNLFVKNFINTILFRFNDNEAKCKLLRGLHNKFDLVKSPFSFF